MDDSARASMESENPLPPPSPNPKANILEAAERLLRFVVLNCGRRIPIEASYLHKEVMKTTNRNINPAMKIALARLEDIYGLTLWEGNHAKGLCYVISSVLPYMDYENEAAQGLRESDAKGILSNLVFTHTFMSDGPVTEESLFKFPNGLDIYVDRPHPVFGDVKEYITRAMVKKGFLQSKKDPISKKTTFEWGFRAEKEISKMEILKSFCEVYKEGEPMDWISQYEAAKKQDLLKKPKFEDYENM